MLIKSIPSYSTLDIAQFLIARNFPYAAQCIRQEMGEKITQLQLEKWLRGYFTAETALSLYRNILAFNTYTNCI